MFVTICRSVSYMGVMNGMKFFVVYVIKFENKMCICGLKLKKKNYFSLKCRKNDNTIWRINHCKVLCWVWQLFLLCIICLGSMTLNLFVVTGKPCYVKSLRIIVKELRMCFYNTQFTHVTLC